MSSPNGRRHVPGHSLSERIRDALVRRIVSEDLQPGERLVETRLAATFGTSQAPVREALRQLETFGLVESKPRRGTYVRPFVQQTFRESYVVRAALEETATRLVLMAGTLPTALLENDVATARDAAERDDREAVGSATVAFHRHIVESAGNSLLEHSWDALAIEARTAVTLMAAPVDLREVAEEHHVLLQSLVDGPLESACRDAWHHQWQYARLAAGTETLGPGHDADQA